MCVSGFSVRNIVYEFVVEICKYYKGDRGAADRQGARVKRSMFLRDLVRVEERALKILKALWRTLKVLKALKALW